MFRTFGARLSAVAVACLASSLALVAVVSYGFFRSSVRSYYEAAYTSYAETMRERIDTLFETTLAANAYLLLDPETQEIYREIYTFQSFAEYQSVSQRIDRLIRQRLLLHPVDLLDVAVLGPEFTYNGAEALNTVGSDTGREALLDQARAAPGRFVELRSPTEERPGRPSAPGISFAGLVPEPARKEGEVFALLTIKPAVIMPEDGILDMAIVGSSGERLWGYRDLIGSAIIADAASGADAGNLADNRLVHLSNDDWVYIARSRSRDWTYAFLFDGQEWHTDRRSYARYLARTNAALLALFGLLAVFGAPRLFWRLRGLRQAAGSVIENPRRARPQELLRIIDRGSGRPRVRTLLLLFLAGITIAACATSTLLSQRTARTRLTARMQASTVAALQERRQSIHLAMSQVERRSAYLAVTPTLQAINSDPLRSGAARAGLDETVTRQRLLADSIASFHVYSSDGSLLYANSTGSSTRRPGIGARPAMPETPEGSVWLASTPDDSNAGAITFVRQVRSPADLADFAFLFVGMEERWLSDQISTGSARGAGISFVVDERGVILAHEDRALLGRELTSLFSSGQDGAYVQVRGQRYHQMRVDLDRAGWTLVELVPGYSITSDLGRYTATVLLAILPVFMAMVLATQYLSGRLSRPLEQITGTVERMSVGLLKSERQNHSRNEVQQLASTFDAMLARLNDLIEDGFLHEIRERELVARRKAAELTALQFQMNPHFLYNTFASVNFLIKLGESDSAVLMVSALTDLLRKAASSAQVISVAEEIAYLDAYLTIIGLRHHGQIVCDVSVEPQIMDASILKFTLQPLVENAVMHGILKGSGEGRIELRGFQSGGSITFTVSDDGIGVVPSRLAAVHRQLADHKDGGAVGLANVLERLRLHYGEEVTLAIENGSAAGCVATVTIPREEGPKR